MTTKNQEHPRALSLLLGALKVPAGKDGVVTVSVSERERDFIVTAVRGYDFLVSEVQQNGPLALEVMTSRAKVDALLDACHEALRYCEAGAVERAPHGQPDLSDVLRAAIAKAEGRAQ